MTSLGYSYVGFLGNVLEQKSYYPGLFFQQYTHPYLLRYEYL